MAIIQATRILSILTILLSSLLAGLIASNEWRLKRAFRNAWQKDIVLIESSGKLPIWKELVGAQVAEASSPLFRDQIDVGQIPIHRDGKHTVEVLVLDATDSRQVHAVIQYDFTDAKGNTVFEFGRTLEIGTYHGIVFWPTRFSDQF
jgi:hypothetical protein